MKHKLKEVLGRMGFTQKFLAEKTGLTEVGISKMINSGTANKSSLDKIADVLGIDISEISEIEVVLKAKYGSDKTPLKIGNLELPCYVLEDGTRVFSGRGIQKAIGSSSPSGSWLSRFIDTSPIRECLSEIKAGEISSFHKMRNPIKFVRNNAGGSQSDTYGYEATLLIDLCDAIIKAGESGADIPVEYVRNANIIIRAVAKTGIIALVDEVTGYNKAKERAENELQKFLNAFMSEEAAKWVKVFGDTFFEDLYKMHDWNWDKTSKRPGVVGTWINDIVYERIAPLVLSELRKKNPKNENGGRNFKHHQFLTKEVGLPKLKQHLEAVHAIATISNYNWSVFMHNIDKAYPKQYQQLSIDFDFDNLQNGD